MSIHCSQGRVKLFKPPEYPDLHHHLSLVFLGMIFQGEIPVEFLENYKIAGRPQVLSLYWLCPSQDLDTI